MRLASLLVFAATVAALAFVGAALVDGHYPFGPDKRPYCGGTPDGVAAGCFGGPLARDWYEPFVWPAIVGFTLVILVGLVVLQRVGQRDADGLRG